MAKRKPKEDLERLTRLLTGADPETIHAVLQFAEAIT